MDDGPRLHEKGRFCVRRAGLVGRLTELLLLFFFLLLLLFVLLLFVIVHVEVGHLADGKVFLLFLSNGNNLLLVFFLLFFHLLIFSVVCAWPQVAVGVFKHQGIVHTTCSRGHVNATDAALATATGNILVQHPGMPLRTGDTNAVRRFGLQEVCDESFGVGGKVAREKPLRIHDPASVVVCVVHHAIGPGVAAGCSTRVQSRTGG